MLDSVLFENDLPFGPKIRREKTDLGLRTGGCLSQPNPAGDGAMDCQGGREIENSALSAVFLYHQSHGPAPTSRQVCILGVRFGRFGGEVGVARISAR